MDFLPSATIRRLNTHKFRMQLLTANQKCRYIKNLNNQRTHFSDKNSSVSTFFFTNQCILIHYIKLISNKTNSIQQLNDSTSVCSLAPLQNISQLIVCNRDIRHWAANRSPISQPLGGLQIVGIGVEIVVKTSDTIRWLVN